MASHRVPPVTVLLGSVLDLHVQLDADRRMFIREWRGWKMLTSELAFENQPGRAKLFLLKGKLTPRGRLDPDNVPDASETHIRWNKREAERLAEMDAPNRIEYVVGRVLRIGYRSDKWNDRGETEDYDHDFLEHDGTPPLLYSSHADISRARGAVLVGGSMVITEGGIA